MAAYQINLPVVMTAQGPQPTPPSAIQTQLIQNITANNPGFTANLPGLLTEDLTSTGVAGIAAIDLLRVESINAVSPSAANLYALTLHQQTYGLAPQGAPTNTSVGLVFTGTVGYVIPNGFLVSDGTHTYQVQTGGAIGSSGSSQVLTAIAVQSGSWSVPAGTVTTPQTAIPGTITLAMSNPNPGIPGGAAESNQAFRARVLQGGLVGSIGSTAYIKTLLGNVPGVQQKLIGVQSTGGGLRIICGGGDNALIAAAIYQAIADPSRLVGSAVNAARNVTVTLSDPPDSVPILFVGPVAQTAGLSITWNTVLTSFTGGAAFASLVQQPLADYINQLGVGQPINTLELAFIFAQAVSGLLDPSLLTKLSIGVLINGSTVAPVAGTYQVNGDAEGFFTCLTSAISVAQG